MSNLLISMFITFFRHMTQMETLKYRNKSQKFLLVKKVVLIIQILNEIITKYLQNLYKFIAQRKKKYSFKDPEIVKF